MKFYLLEAVDPVRRYLRIKSITKRAMQHVDQRDSAASVAKSDPVYNRLSFISHRKASKARDILKKRVSTTYGSLKDASAAARRNRIAKLVKLDRNKFPSAKGSNSISYKTSRRLRLSPKKPPKPLAVKLAPGESRNRYGL